MHEVRRAAGCCPCLRWLSVREDVVGRRSEQEQLVQLLRRAEVGAAQALVLVGDPGIGKTTLLDWLAQRASGWQIRRARGHEADLSTSFLVLRELLATFVRQTPVADSNDGGAFDDLRAAVELRPNGATTERLGVAAIDLLSTSSESQPILLIVDDAHVVDRDSLAVLTFVARRASHERLAVLFAARPPATAEVSFDHRWLDGIDAMNVGALDDESARILLRATDRHLAKTALARCAGNPLALLHQSDVADDEAPLPERLQRAFGGQIESLPQRTQRAVGLLALVGAAEADLFDDAVVTLGCSRKDLLPAVGAGVLQSDTEFVHTLMRAAAGVLIPAACHQALATALDARGLHERALWHRLSAVDGVDPNLAERAERIATDHMNDGRPGTAYRWFEHAVRVADDPDQRFRVLRNAALCLSYAGRYQDASTFFDRALAVAPTARDRLIALRSAPWCWLWAGATVEEAARPLADALREHPPATDDPEVGAAHASLIGLYVQHDIFLAVAASQAAVGHEGIGADVLVAMVLANDPASKELVETVKQHALEADAPDVQRPIFSLPVYGELLSFEGDFVEAERMCAKYSRMVRDHRLDAEVGPAASRLMVAKVFTGRLVDAHALALAAIERQPNDMALLAAAAFVGAAVGDPLAEQWARRALEQAEPRALRQIVLEVHHRLGLVAWSQGEVDRAVEHFERCWSMLTEFGFRCPAIAHARGDIAAAFARVGRVVDARRVIDELELGVLPSAWAIGVAARARGILGEPDGFGRACELLACSPWELARTHYEMAHSGDRGDDALAAPRVLAALGARPWVALAEAALASVGAVEAKDPLADLSDRERAVALVVASGLTNKESAAELYISVKTVDAHLQQIYRKLGVRSRSELAARCYGRPVTAGR
jgi:DNA-binding CsgD family transcriptional regulator